MKKSVVTTMAWLGALLRRCAPDALMDRLLAGRLAP